MLWEGTVWMLNVRNVETAAIFLSSLGAEVWGARYDGDVDAFSVEVRIDVRVLEILDSLWGSVVIYNLRSEVQHVSA